MLKVKDQIVICVRFLTYECLYILKQLKLSKIPIIVSMITMEKIKMVSNVLNKPSTVHNLSIPCSYTSFSSLYKSQSQSENILKNPGKKVRRLLSVVFSHKRSFVIPFPHSKSLHLIRLVRFLSVPMTSCDLYSQNS